MMIKKNVTARIGNEFSKELEEIKKERLERNIDKKKQSTKKLTNLIVKHSSWLKIKEDTMGFDLKNDE